MNTYIAKNTIDDYLADNELNARIYEVLLNFQDSETHCRNKLKKSPFEIFNQVYDICDELQKESHPEEKVPQIYDRLRANFLLCETNVVLSCVYVICFFSDLQNPNLHYSLNRIKQTIDKGYLKEFEQLINDELTRIATTTDCFENLKIEADKIPNLTQRKIFYANFLTHYKQTHNTPNIVQQISDEVDLIQLKIDCFSTPKHEKTSVETESVEVASAKVRSVVLMELLKELKISTANNDLSKICKLISFLIGSSYHNIYKDMKNGVNFSKIHIKHIDEVNQILISLNATFSIDMQKQY